MLTIFENIYGLILFKTQAAVIRAIKMPIQGAGVP